MGKAAMMSDAQKNILVAAVTAVLCILVGFAVHMVQSQEYVGRDHVKVGFVLDGDESAPYSYNFVRAANAIESAYDDRVEVDIRYNVPYDKSREVFEDLAQSGCAIVFSNSYEYGTYAKQVAADYPGVQFCEATCDNANAEPVVANYHTFMGEIYEGRYVTGKVAGMKLREMVESGQIDADEAWVGYVAAYPYPEVISGYTAFLLGVRSECPQARMKVKYTNTWGSYGLEMQAAKQLIDGGCTIISQHSNTIAPAIACEEASAGRPVYHVGYNQDMVDIAPTVSLVGTRINWTPYCVSAVQAVLDNKRIEDVVRGNVHGNDEGAGFKEGWVEILTLNTAIAPQGCAAMIEAAVASLSAGKTSVFVGDYLGVDPFDASDTWDLNKEYHENENSSAPTFHYVLQDVIEVV